MESLNTTQTETTTTPAPSLEAIKAARRATATTQTTAPAQTETTTAVGGVSVDGTATTATTTTEIDIDDKALSQFVEQSRELRTLRDKQKSLEGKAALADKWDQAQKLISEGKHFDAVSLLGEGVLNRAVEEVTGGSVPTTKTDPALKALQDEIDALKANQNKSKEERDAETSQQAAQEREQGVTKIVAEVTAAKEAFPFLSRSPEWVKHALTGADEAYPQLVKKLGRQLSDTEKNTLIKAALEEGEAMRAKEAALYGAPAPKAAPKPAPKTPTTFDASMRGSTSPLYTRDQSGKTIDDLKAERRKAK